MNIVLLFPADFISLKTVSLIGRRLAHVRDVLKPSVNDTVSVGLEGGKIGTGQVTSLNEHEMVMYVSLTDATPMKLPVILCLALMRPIVLKRVLQTAVTMGVEEIIFFHSYRVEKSFWQSSLLAEATLRDLMVLGLEQAKDTILPKISFQKKFKPFVEAVFPALLKGRKGM